MPEDKENTVIKKLSLLKIINMIAKSYKSNVIQNDNLSRVTSYDFLRKSCKDFKKIVNLYKINASYRDKQVSSQRLKYILDAFKNKTSSPSIDSFVDSQLYPSSPRTQRYDTELVKIDLETLKSVFEKEGLQFIWPELFGGNATSTKKVKKDSEYFLDKIEKHKIELLDDEDLKDLVRNLDTKGRIGAYASISIVVHQAILRLKKQNISINTNCFIGDADFLLNLMSKIDNKRFLNNKPRRGINGLVTFEDYIYKPNKIKNHPGLPKICCFEQKNEKKHFLEKAFENILKNG